VYCLSESQTTMSPMLQLRLEQQLRRSTNYGAVNQKSLDKRCNLLVASRPPALRPLESIADVWQALFPGKPRSSFPIPWGLQNHLSLILYVVATWSVAFSRESDDGCRRNKMAVCS